jgi:tetratricopeptide (TPR) repeat protein
MPTRRSTLSKLGMTLATALGVGLLLTLAGMADTIRLVPGSTVKSTGGQIVGQITSESPTEVKIKAATGDQAVPVDQIDEVSYDGAPPSYTLAESRNNAGAVAEAADLFGKAAVEAQGKPLLERAALFARARALAELAQVDPARLPEAVKALEDFTRAHPSSRQVGPALLELTRLHLVANQPDRAEAALSDLSARVPWAADRAAVLKARVRAAKGDPAGAIAALDALIAEAPKESVKAREAKLAKAEALAAQKQFDAAEAVVREVIAEAPPEDAQVQAEAHNTLGDCLSAANRPKDALIAYLKTDILYSSARDQHARALARIAALWTDLKEDGRAAETLERLRQQYPASPYARPRPATPR